MTEPAWIFTSWPHMLGDAIYVMTAKSRRRAVVVASKPGAVLVWVCAGPGLSCMAQE